jgi:uncharacterized protein (UPF0332 family)
MQKQGHGRHHNLIRSAKNKDTHKYAKQAVHTAMNKARHARKALLLKKRADAKTEARKLWLTGLCWPVKK